MYRLLQTQCYFDVGTGKCIVIAYKDTVTQQYLYSLAIERSIHIVKCRAAKGGSCAYILHLSKKHNILS